MIRCTCADPTEKLCHIHRKYKVDIWDDFRKIHYLIRVKWLQLRFHIGKLAMGKLYYDIGKECPKCKSIVYFGKKD